MERPDTIVALATPTGTGAIAVIRVSGPEAVGLVGCVFSKKLSEKKPHTVHLGRIAEGNNSIDEVLVTLFKAPHSYTGEDVVEISCHGSPYIQQQLIQLLLKKGCRMAQPGEFTQRAFLNGKMDLSQAEAVADLIASENEASHQVALQQMRGGFSSEIAQLREELLNFASLIELELDFSEEDVAFADRRQLTKLIQHLKFNIQNLITSFDYGNAIRNGVPVAIVGKPNAGKSTLLNALLNEERAIVSDIPGTTRDTIEEAITLGGITFRFIDTAGLRKTDDTVEAIGVERAKEKIRGAKIVIHLYEDDTEILDEWQTFLQDKTVFNLLSKTDVNQWPNDRYEHFLKEKYPGYFHFGISVKTGFNIDRLKSGLVDSVTADVGENAVIVTNARHFHALSKALESIKGVEDGMASNLSGDLLSIDIRQALHHLGTITGQVTPDDLLGNIFSNFCIGK